MLVVSQVREEGTTPVDDEEDDDEEDDDEEDDDEEDDDEEDDDEEGVDCWLTVDDDCVVLCVKDEDEVLLFDWIYAK